MSQKNILSRKNLAVGVVALVIGLVGLLGSLFLVLRQVTYQGRASPRQIPKEVKLTNLSENSASVSWITDEPTIGSVVYATNAKLNNSLIAFDDRGGSISSTIHHITLKNLKPATSYYFRLISGGRHFDNQGLPYVFSTPQHTSVPPPPPFIIKGKLEKQALVYFSFNDSTPISTVTDENGRYLLSLNNALAKNQQGYYPIQKREKGYLLFRDGKTSWSQEIVVADEITVPKLEIAKAPKSGEKPKTLKSKLPTPTETKLASLITIIIQFFKNLLGVLGVSNV